MSGPRGNVKVRKVRDYVSAEEHFQYVYQRNHVISEKGGASRGSYKEVEPASGRRARGAGGGREVNLTGENGRPVAQATCGQRPLRLSTSVPPAQPLSSYMPFLAFRLLLSYFCVLLCSSSPLQTYSCTFHSQPGR